MATFAQMRTWVSKRLLDPSYTSVSSDDVGEMINQAITYWKKRRFWFNEITDTTTLTTSDNSIPLPDDWLCPSIDNCFVIEYSGIRYILKKISEATYNAMYLTNGIGQPFWFSRQADTEYKVYPIPDKDYTLRRFYLRDYDDLLADGDTSVWTEEAQDLIKYTAAAYGMRDFRQDAAMYDTFMSQAQQEYQNLLVQTRKDNATGSLTLTSIVY